MRFQFSVFPVSRSSASQLRQRLCNFLLGLAVLWAFAVALGRWKLSSCESREFTFPFRAVPFRFAFSIFVFLCDLRLYWSLGTTGVIFFLPRCALGVCRGTVLAMTLRWEFDAWFVWPLDHLRQTQWKLCSLTPVHLSSTGLIYNSPVYMYHFLHIHFTDPHLRSSLQGSFLAKELGCRKLCAFDIFQHLTFSQLHSHIIISHPHIFRSYN